MTIYDFYTNVEPEKSIGNSFISIYNQADSVFTNNKFSRPISMRPGIVTEGLGYDKIFKDFEKMKAVYIMTEDIQADFILNVVDGNLYFEKFYDVNSPDKTRKETVYYLYGNGTLSIKAVNSDDYQFDSWDTRSGIITENPMKIVVNDEWRDYEIYEKTLAPGRVAPVDIDTNNVPDTFSVQGEGNYNVGGQASVSIVPNTGDERIDNEGNTFIGWINPNAVSE